MKKLFLVFLSIFLSSQIHAFSLLDSLHTLTKTTSDSAELGFIYYEIGWQHYPNSPDSMQYYLHKSLALTKAPNIEANALRGIGVSYYLLTDYDKAIEFNSKALNKFQAMGDLHGVAKCYNSIGLNLSSMKNFEPAVEYHWRSMDIANKLLNTINKPDSLLRVKRILGYNYINLILGYEDSNKQDSTLYYAEKSIDVFTSLQDSFYLAMAYNRKAQALYMMQQYEDAVEINQLIYENFSNLSPFEKTFTFLGLAQNYLELGKIDLSIKFGKEGYEMAKSNNAIWHAQHFARVLASAYAKINNYKAAYEYHVEFKTYSDSLFNQDTETRINYTLLKQKELENERLTQTNALKEYQLKTKNQQTIILIVGILLLFIFAILQYNNSKKLKELNQRLETTNASKDKFFSIIAHDLKSPLNSILGFFNLLKARITQLSEEELQEFIDMMLATTNNTYKLLENLLEWSRLQAGDISFKPEQIELNNILAENVELMSKVAEKKEIELKLYNSQLVHAYADKNMLSTVLRNLISNAIKFTKTGGHVSIDYQLQNGMAYVSIKDTGIGIPKEILHKLFVISEKHSTQGTDKEKGTGLGLSLSKEFIEQQGGEISVESTLGKGSTFTFTLPITKP